MKKILIPVLFILILILSSCGNLNNQSSSYRTQVDIIDPYGNKLYIDGTINGLKIQADKSGVYVAGKIESVTSYKFDTSLELFSVRTVEVDPGKSVKIFLEENGKRGVKLFRTSEGYLMFYAIGLGDKPYFQVWLKDKLLGHFYTDLNEDQVLLAGNWLVGVGKGRGQKGVNMSKEKIVIKLPIPTKNQPEIVKFEEIKTK